MAPEQSRPRDADEVADYDRGVWDMVQHMVHPVALYVLLQVLLASRWTGHPALDGFEPAVFGGQFLGAWAVFYGTLLRDMGFRSFAPLLLVFLTAAGVLWQYAVHRDPLAASDAAVRGFFAVQLVPAAVVWVVTLIRWRRLKARHAPEEPS